MRWKYSRPLLAVFIALLVVAPLISGNPLASSGLQQTLAVAFLWGALALTYDLLFGFTGLLSFGHALFFATGMYVTVIFINHNVMPWWVAVLSSMAISSLLATLIGAASLRTKGIAFAMVTLAFGEAGHVIISRNFGGLTNGENGVALVVDKIPSFWIGVINTKYLFWTSIFVLLLTYFVIWWVTESSAGRVFAALRDNEVRVQVLGLNTQKYKLLAFVISAALASLIGSTMLLVAGTAAPRYATADVTIALLLMVILGGPVTRWGAVLGGIIYSIASTRLQDLTQSSALASIPTVLKGPLTEPAFTLGILFILVVMFAPGGLSGAYYRARVKYLKRALSK